jgi:murein DD-endopeptidase MepM/ murein hydrolase activator NlpD
MPISPVNVSINHEYGEKRPTKNNPTRKHNGVDYIAPFHTLVRASAAGRVVRASMHNPRIECFMDKNSKLKERFIGGGYGNVIIIEHIPRLKEESSEVEFPVYRLEQKSYIYTLYAHLDKIDLKASYGKTVIQGQKIGESGRTGTIEDYHKRKGGYHLHFEVAVSSIRLNWRKDGRMGYRGNQYRVNPKKFLRGNFGNIFEAPDDNNKKPDKLLWVHGVHITKPFDRLSGR